MNAEAFDDAVVFDVLGENFFHVLLGLGRVPDIVRINHHGRTVLAGVQAPGFVDPHLAFQAAFMHPFFEIVEQVHRSARTATAAGVVRLSLVVAHENVFDEPAHDFSNADKFQESIFGGM